MSLTDEAIDNVLGTLDLTPGEKLRLAHRLVMDVAQTADEHMLKRSRLVTIGTGLRDIAYAER
jgi:hypothetical protein